MSPHCPLRAQLHEATEALKGERLTRDLMTKELRTALTRQRRAARALEARGGEVGRLKDEVLLLRRAAAAAAADLNEKDDVVKVCARCAVRCCGFVVELGRARTGTDRSAGRRGCGRLRAVQVALQSLKGLAALQDGGSPPRALVDPVATGGVRGTDSVQGYEASQGRAAARRRARCVAASQADTACESLSLRGGGGARSSTEGMLKRGSPARTVRDAIFRRAFWRHWLESTFRKVLRGVQVAAPQRGGSVLDSASSGEDLGVAGLTASQEQAFKAAGVTDVQAMRASRKLDAEIAHLSSSLTSACEDKGVVGLTASQVQAFRAAGVTDIQAMRASRKLDAEIAQLSSSLTSAGEDKGVVGLTNSQLQAFKSAGVPDIGSLRSSHKLDAEIAQLSSSLTSAIKERCVISGRFGCLRGHCSPALRRGETENPDFAHHPPKHWAAAPN